MLNSPAVMRLHPLMRGIEAARVADHAHEPRLALERRDGLGICPAVRQRNLHLHMLAGAQALQRLCGMHLRRGAENRGIHARLRKRFGELGRGVAHAVFRRGGTGGFKIAAHQRHHLDAADELDGVEVFLAECTGAGKNDFHQVFSSTRWPMAVLDAGTW